MVAAKTWAFKGAMKNEKGNDLDTRDTCERLVFYKFQPFARGLSNESKYLVCIDIFREHKSQMKRFAINEEDGGTGSEEVVSFIDLQQNNLTKLPEKGILKKHGGYGIVL